MRWEVSALEVLFAGLIAGCAAAPASRPRTNVAPPRSATGALSVEANRNAPPPAIDEAAEDVAALVLFCSQPGGVACAAAQQELGQAPTPAETVPWTILEHARDSDDDCSDPDIAPLMQRVTHAVGASGAWVDHLGAVTSPEVLIDPFHGSGCMNAPQPAEPVVKIHAADAPDGVRFLVRIWEIGDV